MNNINHKELVQTAVKKKFRGTKQLTAKTIPHYPMSVEREFQRVSKAYMKLFRRALRNHLPAITNAYKQSRSDSRFDGIDWRQIIDQEILDTVDEFEQFVADFDLESYIRRISQMASNRSISEWRRLVYKTFGLDILEDYYKGEFYAEILERWIATNVSLIKTVPSNTLAALEEIIIEGYRNGVSLATLKRQIQAVYDVNEAKATFWARDQIAKLNADLTKTQQIDAGVTRYKWSTSLDSRVRDCHAELHGQVFEWNDPPEMWYENKTGKIYTGRRCHPGEDYQCRCVAIPIFDWQSVDLPIG